MPRSATRSSSERVSGVAARRADQSARVKERYSSSSAIAGKRTQAQSAPATSAATSGEAAAVTPTPGIGAENR